MNNSFKKKTCISLLSLSVMTACSTGVEDEAVVTNPAEVDLALIEPSVLVDTTQQAPVTEPGRREIRVRADQAVAGNAVRELEEQVASTAAVLAPQYRQQYSDSNVLHVAPNRENYANIDDNRINQVLQAPVSTFSIDVDTASYSNVRRFLHNGQMPPADAVRTEELINYFSYQYPRADSNEQPFAIHTEISTSPWNTGKHLLHIGLQAVEPGQVEEPAANLVFLVDVSGSMNSPDKLGLLKSSLKLLTRQLDENDSVALVVYAGASGVVLKPTPGNQERRIIAALDRLSAGGSTNGAAGIELAYQMAESAFIEGGINRVILATDGDFNVGVVNFEALKDMISKKRQTGISLTTLGFGTGNINDHLMEQLADNGNGNYAYIDTLNEARKVLVDEMASTLQTVAKDVKIQIEFNPALVAEYRLVGYENRLLNREDFNNDKVDAGEIGAGHTVTALYEISLANGDTVSVDPLRYAGNRPVLRESEESELGFLKLRYKAPDADTSVLIEHPLRMADISDSLEQTSDDYRFSAAVAGFAQLLRDHSSFSTFSYDDVIALAQPARGDDEFGYRAEFINLVKTASALH